MSRIASEFFTNSPVLLFPIIGLLLFAAVFIAVCVRTARLSEEQVRERACLPLGKEDHHG